MGLEDGRLGDRDGVSPAGHDVRNVVELVGVRRIGPDGWGPAVLGGCKPVGFDGWRLVVAMTG